MCQAGLAACLAQRGERFLQGAPDVRAMLWVILGEFKERMHRLGVGHRVGVGPHLVEHHVHRLYQVAAAREAFDPGVVHVLRHEGWIHVLDRV